MLVRLKMEWLLLRRDRGYWGGLFLLSLLTVLAFQVGWSRMKQQARLHQRFLSERTDLLTVFQASVADHEKQREEKSVEGISRVGVTTDLPPIDFESLLNRKVSPLEQSQYSWMWSSARTSAGMIFLSTSFKVWRPPTVTGALSVGEADQWPEFFVPQLSSRENIPFPSVAKTLSASRIVNPFHLDIGAFDLSTLLIVIVPLVIVVLTYDVLSKDREQGILRMLTSQNQSVSSRILVRLCLRILGIVILFLGTILACYGISGADLTDSMTWQLLGTFSLAVCFYALFWGSLVGGVNALGCSSTTNAVVLAVSWIILVCVLPLSISQSVAHAYPVSRAGSLAEREKEIQKSIRELQMQATLDTRETHGEATPASRTEQIARMQEEARRGTETLYRSMEQDVTRFYAQHQQRAEAIQFWQSLSPPLAMKMICDTIAGNSHDQFLRFTKKISDDHRDFLAGFQSQPHSNRRLTSDDLRQMSCFPIVSPVADIHWLPVLWSLVTIAFWGMILAILGWGILRL